MNHKCIAVLLLGLLAGTSLQAIEAEPDWGARFDTVRHEEWTAFKSPAIGSQVSVIRRVGGKITAQVTAVTSNSITLDGDTYRASQLIPESCERLFPAWYVEKAATRRVLLEQQNYQVRKEEEERNAKVENQKRQADARKLEDQRRVAGEQSQLRQESEEKQKAQQKRLLEKENTERKEVRSMAVMIAFIVAGLFIYFLPSMIASKRNHQNGKAILALNIFLGWTFLGWVASLVWALTHVVRNLPPANQQPGSTGKKIIIKKPQDPSDLR